jgi:hypothetical protein
MLSGQSAHGPFGKSDRKRRRELFPFGMHEHDLDVVLEQHLPQPQTLVHPRTA